MTRVEDQLTEYFEWLDGEFDGAASAGRAVADVPRGAHHRASVRSLVAAAAGFGLLVTGLVVIASRDRAVAPTVAPSPSVAPTVPPSVSAPSVVTSAPPVISTAAPAWDGQASLPLPSAASCAVEFSVGELAQRAFAFDGTVVAIGPPTDAAGVNAPVTFAVHEWWRGGAEQASVTVDVVLPMAVAVSVDAPSWGPGSRLLITGEPRWGGDPLDQPVAWACGFSRTYDPSTADAWRTTFASAPARVDTGPGPTLVPPATPDARTLVGAALAELGVDVAGVPGDVAASLEQVQTGFARWCGVDARPAVNFDVAHPAARQCFLDAHVVGAPAVFIEPGFTSEGDPVVSVWRAEPDGSVLQLVDATRDHFGSGDWESVPCASVTTAVIVPGAHPTLFACSDEPALPPGNVSAAMPAWFVERESLPPCGYFVAGPQQLTLGNAAWQCLADARDRGAAAELVVAFGAPRGVMWLRTLAGGSAERIDWVANDQSPNPGWVRTRGCEFTVETTERGQGNSVSCIP